MKRQIEEEEDGFLKTQTLLLAKPAAAVFVVGIPQASLQCLLLLIITILVTIWHERGRPGDMALIALQTWAVSGADPCRHYEIEEGTCFNTSCHGGYERPQGEADQRLFSIVCVPFLILCSHVIATPFFIGYVRESSHDESHSNSSTLQKNLKRVSLLMLLVFACSFLFLQAEWRLPGNHMLLCELWLICTLFYISFHPSSHYSEYARQQYTPTRYLEFAFTLPLLSVAAAAASGMTDVDDINWIFFTSLFMCLFLLCVEYHHHKTTVLLEEADDAFTRATWILLLNALFCLVALLVPAIRCVHQGLQQQKHLEWGPLSLVMLLILHGSYFLAVAVYHGFHSDHGMLILLLDGISLVGRTLVSLLIIGGALDMQSF